MGTGVARDERDPTLEQPHLGGARQGLRLRVATKRSVREAILDAWLAKAPEQLAREHLAARPR